MKGKMKMKKVKSIFFMILLFTWLISYLFGLLFLIFKGVIISVNFHNYNGILVHIFSSSIIEGVYCWAFTSTLFVLVYIIYLSERNINKYKNKISELEKQLEEYQKLNDLNKDLSE